MKNKILILAIIAVLINSSSFAQLIPFGFVKNCMSYGRTTVTDELKKKQFFIVERKLEVANNKLLEGATYYSNEQERDVTKGEIAVLSLINGSKQITEISFINGSKNDYTKNYNDVYNQMISFFKDEKSFKSSRYKTDIKTFNKNNVNYYVFKNNTIPVIVISNYKLEQDYFSN